MLNLRNSFPGQESNEVIYIFARPYFFAFLPNVLIFAVAILFSFGLEYTIANGLIFEFSPFAVNSAIITLGIFQLICLVVFLIAIFDFYYDILIVTNQRLVDISQEQLFSRPIAELNLIDIQDVRSDVTGTFHTILDYGDVTIQTAGERTNFLAEDLRHPREIISIISDLAQQAKDNVPEDLRRPRTRFVGAINSQLVTNLSDLASLGAIRPEEVSRIVSATEHAPE